MSGSFSGQQPQSLVRVPWLRLLANSNVIAGAISIEINTNNHYAANRVSGEISLNADPAFGLKWWEAQTDIQLEAQMALTNTLADNPSWQSIVVANIDDMTFDLDTMCLHFDARDLVSVFMNTRTQATYANQTSSQIAQTLAAEHGMQANVTPTSTLVGQYYQLEHDRMRMNQFSHQVTEWDLLTYLAQEEDYNVWVQGNTLYFQPATSQKTTPALTVAYQAPNAQTPYPMFNVTSLKCRRSLMLAKDIQVTVKTTNLKNGASYFRTTKAIGAKSASQANSQTQNYVFTKPGLTPDQALKYAQQKLAELTRHERNIDIEMPGELSLTAQSMIQITGTNSGFDQEYWIDEITRTLDFDGQGFRQTIRARNTSPRNQAVVQ